MKRYIFLLSLLFLSSVSYAQPVVGVHGILLSFRSLYPVKTVLQSACMDVYLFPYDSRKTFVCTHADRLKEYLKCVAAAHPGEPIDFVTHSVGAWVLRRALNFPDCPQEAKMGRAVLLAPPNKGTYLGRKLQNFPPLQFLFGDKLGWELLTYTEEDVICQYGNFPSTMEIFVLAGSKGIHPYFHGCPNDTYLMVEETLLNTPHFHQTLPLTHGDLLKNVYALRLTRDFLLRCP